MTFILLKYYTNHRLVLAFVRLPVFNKLPQPFVTFHNN